MSVTCSLQKKKSSSVSNQTTYVKVMPLRTLTDTDKIIDEVIKGHILIIRIAPLEKWDIEEMKSAVHRLRHFLSERGGDIARLSIERIILTPPTVKIWRGE